MTRPLAGLWTAVLTPIDRAYRCDVGRLAAHCRHLFDQGCDGVALFGTTGEGPAFGAADRRRVLDELLASGLPADRLIVSASTASLPDSIDLARQDDNIRVLIITGTGRAFSAGQDLGEVVRGQVVTAVG